MLPYRKTAFVRVPAICQTPGTLPCQKKIKYSKKNKWNRPETIAHPSDTVPVFLLQLPNGSDGGMHLNFLCAKSL